MFLTNPSWVSPLITLVVGFFAFVIYKFEKNDKEKAAAQIILEELRAIDRNFKRLQSGTDFLDIDPDSFSANGWLHNKSIVIKYLDSDQVSELNQYYEKVAAVKDMVELWRSTYFKSIESKTSAIQEILITLAKEMIADNQEGLITNFDTLQRNYQVRRDEITTIIHQDSYWFKPFLMEDRINKILPSVTAVLTTSTGEKLKSITHRSLLRPKTWFV